MYSWAISTWRPKVYHCGGGVPKADIVCLFYGFSYMRASLISFWGASSLAALTYIIYIFLFLQTLVTLKDVKNQSDTSFHFSLSLSRIIGRGFCGNDTDMNDQETFLFMLFWTSFIHTHYPWWHALKWKSWRTKLEAQKTVIHSSGNDIQRNNMPNLFGEIHWKCACLT